MTVILIKNRLRLIDITDIMLLKQLHKYMSSQLVYVKTMCPTLSSNRLTRHTLSVRIRLTLQKSINSNADNIAN